MIAFVVFHTNKWLYAFTKDRSHVFVFNSRLTGFLVAPASWQTNKKLVKIFVWQNFMI